MNDDAKITIEQIKAAMAAARRYFSEEWTKAMPPPPASAENKAEMEYNIAVHTLKAAISMFDDSEEIYCGLVEASGGREEIEKTLIELIQFSYKAPGKTELDKINVRLARESWEVFARELGLRIVQKPVALLVSNDGIYLNLYGTDDSLAEYDVVYAHRGGPVTNEDRLGGQKLEYAAVVLDRLKDEGRKVAFVMIHDPTIPHEMKGFYEGAEEIAGQTVDQLVDGEIKRLTDEIVESSVVGQMLLGLKDFLRVTPDTDITLEAAEQRELVEDAASGLDSVIDDGEDALRGIVEKSVREAVEKERPAIERARMVAKYRLSQMPSEQGMLLLKAMKAPESNYRTTPVMVDGVFPDRREAFMEAGAQIVMTSSDRALYFNEKVALVGGFVKPGAGMTGGGRKGEGPASAQTI